jgi:hypothetical protein
MKTKGSVDRGPRNIEGKPPHGNPPCGAPTEQLMTWMNCGTRVKVN